MPTAASLLTDLKKKGSEKTRVIYARHGNKSERAFGVSIADLKIAAKTLKGQQPLANELYKTGKLEAMYLAGLIADGSRMTPEQLHEWASEAGGLQMISEYTVPWVTIENSHGRDLAMRWMECEEEHIVCSGWCTYSGLVATKPDETLDLSEIEGLLHTAVQRIRRAENRVRYTMNGFIISVGSHVKPLSARAKAAAAQIGGVSVDMGETACKVPLATEYIEKIEAAGRVGWKRKTMRC